MARPHKCCAKRSLIEIIRNYTGKFFCDPRKIVSTKRCRRCGHVIGCPNFHIKLRRQRTSSSINWDVVCFSIVLVALLIILAGILYFVRQYNLKFIYGAGGCLPSSFWNYIDCPIMV